MRLATSMVTSRNWLSVCIGSDTNSVGSGSVDFDIYEGLFTEKTQYKQRRHKRRQSWSELCLIYIRNIAYCYDFVKGITSST